MARWLQRPDPITLEYELDTAASSSVSTVYDIDMTVADPALSHIDQFLRGIVSQSSAITDIVQSDLQLAQSCSKAKAVKARRDVCAAFASDPIGFIFDFLESQSIDLDAYLNQNAEKGALAQTTSMWGMPNLEDMRRAEFWSQGWTEEGVRLISQRQLVSASLQANAAARQHYGRR